MSRFDPERACVVLLDHLVGEGKQLRRHLDAERARCLQVDD